MANIDEKTSASRLGSGLNLIGNGAWMTNFGNESENDFIMKSIDRNRDMNKATVTPCEAEINPNEQ